MVAAEGAGDPDLQDDGVPGGTTTKAMEEGAEVGALSAEALLDLGVGRGGLDDRRGCGVPAGKMVRPPPPCRGTSSMSLGPVVRGGAELDLRLRRAGA